MNFAILLAGGIGTRVHTDVPKQYTRVSGRMLVTYALTPLLCCERIDGVYIAAEQRWRGLIVEDARESGLDIEKIKGYVQPGSNRQGSILNGMQEVLLGRDEAKAMAGGEDTVLIHDAARPLLSADLLNRCFEAMEGHDGVMPVLAMKDTVYLSRDGNAVSGLLDRSEVYAGQAPELFRLGAYYEANRRLLPDGISRVNGATEPAVLAGMDIVMIPGEERNFKITTDEDLESFCRMVERGTMKL